MQQVQGERVEALATAERAAGGGPAADELYRIIGERRPNAAFQPLVDLRTARVIGYQGWAYGPSDSLLHAPGRLLRAARRAGLAYEMESLAAEAVAESFAAHRLTGLLFLSVSADMLVLHRVRYSSVLHGLRRQTLDPERVVLQLHDQEAGYPYRYDALLRAAEHFRMLGFRLAADGFGEDLEGLAQWGGLGLAYVKLDRPFVQDIDRDPVKRRFVASLLDRAAEQGCEVIAEGIASHSELSVLASLGVAYGQGQHLGRATAHPSGVASAEVVKALVGRADRVVAHPAAGHSVLEQRLLIRVPAVDPQTSNVDLFRRFEADPELHAVAVVRDGVPVGLINRHALLDRLARPYHHELYDRRPCSLFMDTDPLIVDKRLSIQELSYLVAGGDRRHLSNGFIVSDNGEYLGVGTGHDLMREITDLQIQAARHANPLTELPGNVPIDERMDHLLAEGEPFVVCYCDLDHFKPFNDVYGFSNGDAIIKLTARLLIEAADPLLDFVGHIGGDDFIVLFRSVDWQGRCEQVLQRFGDEVLAFFSDDDRERGGYVTENRQGKKEFHALTSLSIGAVRVAPGSFSSRMELAHVAAEAKKAAKTRPGNTLFINQRQYGADPAGADAH